MIVTVEIDDIQEQIADPRAAHDDKCLEFFSKPLTNFSSLTESSFLHGALRFRILHKRFPNETAALIFGH